MANIIIKNPDKAEKPRVFLDGSKRAVAILDSAVIGKGTYLSGWKWSLHAGPQTGKSSQNHIGYIISGQMMAKSADGQEKLVGPGDAFEMGPGHDGWVVGNEPCVALDFEHIETKNNK